MSRYPFVRLLLHPNVREPGPFLPILNTFRRGKGRILDEQFFSTLLEEALLQESGVGGGQTASVVINIVFWTEQGEVNTDALKACPSIVIVLLDALLGKHLSHSAGEPCANLCELLEVLLRLESAAKDTLSDSLQTLSAHLQAEENANKKTQLMELLQVVSFHDHVLQACTRRLHELDQDTTTDWNVSESHKKRQLTALVYGYVTLMVCCGELPLAKVETVTENPFLQTFLHAMPPSFFDVLLAPGATLRARLLKFLKKHFQILPEYDEMLSGQNGGHIFVSKQFYQGISFLKSFHCLLRNFHFRRVMSSQVRYRCCQDQSICRSRFCTRSLTQRSRSDTISCWWCWWPSSSRTTPT